MWRHLPFICVQTGDTSLKSLVDTVALFFFMLKVEYYANENPLKMSEKNNVCWWKVNVSNNEKIIISYHASFVVKCHLVFTFYIKNSNKKLFFNRKYIAKITNPITKPMFLQII